MAIIRKQLTRSEFTKADNNIVRNKELSDGAKVLYWFMASQKNAFELNDGFIEKGLGWSRQKIHRCKVALKNNGLIYIEKIDRKTYFLYIGSSEMSAIEVKNNWKKLEGNQE